jgi:TRAP-type C4-dicarboxylate transport system permease small subunit
MEEDAGERARRAVEQQQSALPSAWRSFDRGLLRVTSVVLFAVGAVFTLMVTAEVLSRKFLSFSLFFVNPGARLLLVWFFLLGAGVALRHNAHVGFELLVSRLDGTSKRRVLTVAYVCSLVFFLEMVWGGFYSIAPAVGFALLTYHVIVLLAVLWGDPRHVEAVEPTSASAAS